MKLFKFISLYFRKCFNLIVTLSIIMILTSVRMFGQELPPRPSSTPPGIPEPPPRPLIVTVNGSQNLSFGAFYQGNAGGSVIIFPNGSRSATGDVVLLNMGYSFSTGLFDVVAYPGTLVSILDGPDATLTGSNGGSMVLRVRNTDMLHPFIINTMPPGATILSVGGTLIVGSPLANPAGSYSGTYNLTFVQE